MEWDSRKAASWAPPCRRLYLARQQRAADLRSAGDAAGASSVRSQTTKREYGFSKGKRGAVLKAPAGKTRITIRLDNDVLDWFRAQVHAAGGGNYQSLINQALQQHIGARREPLEQTLRRVLREELSRGLKSAANG